MPVAVPCLRQQLRGMMALRAEVAAVPAPRTMKPMGQGPWSFGRAAPAPWTAVPLQLPWRPQRLPQRRLLASAARPPLAAAVVAVGRPVVGPRVVAVAVSSSAAAAAKELAAAGVAFVWVSAGVWALVAVVEVPTCLLATKRQVCPRQGKGGTCRECRSLLHRRGNTRRCVEIRLVAISTAPQLPWRRQHQRCRCRLSHRWRPTFAEHEERVHPRPPMLSQCGSWRTPWGRLGVVLGMVPSPRRPLLSGTAEWASERM